MKRLSAQLIHPIDLLTTTDVADGMGGVVETDAVFHSCKAAIWPVKANEAVKNMREGLSVTHKIRIRYFPNVTSKIRVKFGTRIFEIKSIINPDEKNKVLDMVCNEQL